MNVKTITRIKFFFMIILPALAVVELANLERVFIIQPETASPIYLVLFAVLAVFIYRYWKRCRKCGKWNAVKEISREEINRMEHPQDDPARGGKAKRKVYQVRISITKKCKHCGNERLYEVIKEIKE